MKRLLPLVLAIASAVAAEPVVVEIPQAGGPLRLLVDGSEFALGRAIARPALPAAPGRVGIARAAAALAPPGVRLGLVARPASRPQERVVITGRVVLAVQPGLADARAAAHGLRIVRRFAWTDRFVVAEPVAGDAFAAIDAADRLRAAGAWAEPELILPLRRLAEPTGNPLYATQWHLSNTGPTPAGNVATGVNPVAGMDINIVPHWTGLGPIRTGAGINVAVVDDGLELTHPDLAAGLDTAIDADYVDNDGVPGFTSALQDGHGTNVAGLIGARDNAIGGVGVAYGCTLVGLRIFEGGGASLVDAAEAIAHRVSATSGVIHVSNNSWGPPRFGEDTAALPATLRTAMQAAVDQGRGGRGTVIVFAAGNDRDVLEKDADQNIIDVGDDALDWNAINGHRRVIAVGALGPDGSFAPYSEPGVGLLISAPGGIVGAGLVSTDLLGNAGFQPGDYTVQAPAADPNDDDELPNAIVVSGTSFAAPLVAGTVAMLLEARPQLSWRDVMHVLARSAEDFTGSFNAAGLRFSNDYGAGRLDVTAALAEAAAWTPLPPATSVAAAAASAALAIPDNTTTWVGKDITITADQDFTVEHAELTVDLDHSWRGDIEFRLIAPSGTTATMTRRPLDGTDDLTGWTFTSVQTMGERATAPASGTGTWRVEVRDREAGITGSLGACSLTLHGYRPYAAAAPTQIFPSAVLNTGAQPDTQVSVTGGPLAVSEGDDLLGTMSLGATTNVSVARDAAGWAAITVPAATFAALAAGPATVTLTNPQVRGVNYALAGGGAGTIALTVRATNAVPVMATVANGTVIAGFPTTSGAATFTDADGDAMRYRLGTAPAMGSATVNLLTGVVTYTPVVTSMGSDSLTVIATDGMGDSVPVTISYTVERNLSAGLERPAAGSGGGGGGGGCGAGSGGAIGGLAGLIALLTLRRRRRSTLAGGAAALQAAVGEALDPVPASRRPVAGEDQVGAADAAAPALVDMAGHQHVGAASRGAHPPGIDEDAAHG